VRVWASAIGEELGNKGPGKKKEDRGIGAGRNIKQKTHQSVRANPGTRVGGFDGMRKSATGVLASRHLVKNQQSMDYVGRKNLKKSLALSDPSEEKSLTTQGNQTNGLKLTNIRCPERLSIVSFGDKGEPNEFKAKVQSFRFLQYRADEQSVEKRKAGTKSNGKNDRLSRLVQG